MTAVFNRRLLLGTTAAGLAGLAVGRAAEAEPRRRFTMALGCGAIGVRAGPQEAIELAGRFGFESVEPAADYLARLTDGGLSELLAGMKAKKLVWSASGLPVEFRGTEAAFQEGMKRMPAFAGALQRAGATRVATWLSPSHASLTYSAISASTPGAFARWPRPWTPTGCVWASNTSAPRPRGVPTVSPSSTPWPR